MEDKDEKKIVVISKIKNKKRIFVPILLIIIIFLLFYPNKNRKIKINVKNTLEKIIEKSDLETANITYNVIAKQCKDNESCDKTSNNIDDFKYVVSCKGTITAGIDFKKIKIDVDTKNKKLIITIPEATIKGEPTIGSIKFLNGSDLPADVIPEARSLCQDTVKYKSEIDEKLIPEAKNQAVVVLENFYKQWIKAYDSSYQVEIK